jgi:hypothetical protein
MHHLHPRQLTIGARNAPYLSEVDNQEYFYILN